MANATVRLYFNDGSHTYTFPLVQSISDPEEGMKDTVIEGIRADGSLVIPGGKKSAEITVKGVILKNTGYQDIITEMNNMRTNVTNSVATLSLQYLSGITWINSWAYVVKRRGAIRFEDSLRYVEQPYECVFLVLQY